MGENDPISFRPNDVDKAYLDRLMEKFKISTRTELIRKLIANEIERESYSENNQGQNIPTEYEESAQPPNLYQYSIYQTRALRKMSRSQLISLVETLWHRREGDRKTIAIMADEISQLRQLAAYYQFYHPKRDSFDRMCDLMTNIYLARR